MLCDAAKAERRLADAKLAKAEAARTRIEVANRDLEVARTLVAKAGKALDLAETGYDQIREVELMVGVKKEMVKDAQIALDTAEHQLEFTQVRAPFPGVVVKRYRNLGDFASPGVADPEHVQPRPALRDGQPGGDAPARRRCRATRSSCGWTPSPSRSGAGSSGSTNRPGPSSP